MKFFKFSIYFFCLFFFSLPSLAQILDDAESIGMELEQVRHEAWASDAQGREREFRKIGKELCVQTLYEIIDDLPIFIENRCERFSLRGFSSAFFSKCCEYSKPVDSFSAYKWNGEVISSPFPAIVSIEEFSRSIDQFSKIMRSQLLYKWFRVEPKRRNGRRYVQKLVVESDSEIICVGDLHGSMHSLLRNLLRLQHKGYLEDNLKIINPNHYIIFTGDYADRGRYGVEVWYILMKLKIINPDQVFLLRGNHENIRMAEAYDFGLELAAKYNCSIKNKIFRLFSLLPIAIFVGHSDKFVQYCHGGIPVNDDTNEVLFDLNFLLNAESKIAYQYISFGHDFIWGDFVEGSDIFDGSRSSGELQIGVDLVPTILTSYNIMTVFRGHQHNNNAVSIMGEDGQWQGLASGEGFTVNQHSVYTFMSCPEGVGGVCDVDGFGILKIAEDYDNWILTPYEYVLPKERHNKYVFFRPEEVKFFWLEKI